MYGSAHPPALPLSVDTSFLARAHVKPPASSWACSCPFFHHYFLFGQLTVISYVAHRCRERNLHCHSPPPRRRSHNSNRNRHGAPPRKRGHIMAHHLPLADSFPPASLFAGAGVAAPHGAATMMKMSSPPQAAHLPPPPPSHIPHVPWSVQQQLPPENPEGWEEYGWEQQELREGRDAGVCVCVCVNLS